MLNSAVSLCMHLPRVDVIYTSRHDFKVLLDVLSSNGLHDTALKMATQTQEPSWGWWWTKNATTCWEVSFY